MEYCFSHRVVDELLVNELACFPTAIRQADQPTKTSQRMYSSLHGVNTSTTRESSIADAPCSTPPRTTKVSPVRTSTVLPWHVILRCPCMTYTTCSCGCLCTVPTQPFTISCYARNSLSLSATSHRV